MQSLPSCTDQGSPGTNLALSQPQGSALRLAVPPWGAALSLPSQSQGKVAFCRRGGDKAAHSASPAVGRGEAKQCLALEMPGLHTQDTVRALT